VKAPLAGVRVIAVEQAVAAPVCSRHLADLGADVIKIERPGAGDFSRQYDGFVDGWSSHFVWLNRGKRSVELDLKSAAGVAALAALLAEADVLVTNLGPGAFERILPDAQLAAANPGLIRCYLSGYGQDGPYRARKAYDALIQGEAGTIAATGSPDQAAKPGVSLADLAGGVYSLAAINAALFDRERDGRGQRIDIALFDILLEWMAPLLLAQRYTGSVPGRTGTHHATIVPYGGYATGDGGQILLAVQNAGQWQRLCEVVLADPGLAADPRFRTNADRLQHRDELEARIAAHFLGLDLAAATRQLEAADVPYGLINELPDVLGHPQAIARGRWTDGLLPDGSTFWTVTSPFHTEPGPPGAVPALGQHTAEVLGGHRPRSGTATPSDPEQPDAHEKGFSLGHG
jgi:itaconate CoA-transferase